MEELKNTNQDKKTENSSYNASSIRVTYEGLRSC